VANRPPPIAQSRPNSLPSQKVRIVLAILFICIAAEAEPLRVSINRMSVSASVLFAQERGLFEKAGLEVQLREFELGKIALEEMISGNLDIAFAAVTPIAYKSISGEEFKILGSVASSTGMVALAARKDLGIQKLIDIRGKRIGLARQTSGEYFFDTLRVLNRIPRDAVSVENRTVDGMVTGLMDGSLDAVSLWEPQLQMLRMNLTNKLVLFYGDGLYTFTWNMVTLPRTIDRRRVELEKFVAVLFEAADMIENDPAKAAAELVNTLGEQGRDVTIGIKDTRYRPQIGQELLVQLEGEARWIISRDQRTNVAPNFLRWLDTSILKRSRPSAVTVIQ
jgi:ABC-type nitrate/sulfonate/bicarbonate transport system substrate-binding protein